MKRKTVYWVQPLEWMGWYNKKHWYSDYGCTIAFISTIKNVRKMVKKYPDAAFNVERVVYQKGERWHYPEFILKMRNGRIVKLPKRGNYEQQ